MREHFSDVIFDYDLTPEKQEHLKEVATSKDIKLYRLVFGLLHAKSGRKCFLLPKTRRWNL